MSSAQLGRLLSLFSRLTEPYLTNLSYDDDAGPRPLARTSGLAQAMSMICEPEPLRTSPNVSIPMFKAGVSVGCSGPSGLASVGR